MSSADIEFRMKTMIGKVHKVLIEVIIVRSFKYFQWLLKIPDF